MDKQKAIEFLKSCSHEIDCGIYGEINICDCGFADALAALEESEPKCGTCGDTKEVWDTQEFSGREVGDKIPCPKCQKPAVEPSEFTKAAREEMVITVTTNCKATSRQPNVTPVNCDLQTACDIIDRQAAEIKELKGGDA